jgi:lipopolysaccharide transport system ATP-binding protein
MSSEPAIRVRGLTKAYRIGLQQRSLREVLTERPWARHPARHQRFVALDDVSLDVAQGEILGVIGRNGAGKSTLLKILSRVTSPDAGSAELYGRVGSLLEVGTGFHPELTGRENIELNGTILGMRRSEIARAFDEIVDFSEIGPFLDTPVKRFSSGMYVRLAFAVAAHLDSEIMIVDEVLAVGDAAFQSRCLAKIESIAQTEGRTVLFVSHNLAPIRRLCQRVVVLERGSVQFDGEPRLGAEHYLSLLRHTAGGQEHDQADLSRRENPHDDGSLWLRTLTLRGEDGEPSRIVRIGGSMTMSIEVDLVRQVRDPVVGVRLLNDLDQTLAGFTLELHQLLESAGIAAASRCTVELQIPSLPLAPGTYSVDLGMSVGLGGPMLDEAFRAGVVEVTAPGVDRSEWSRMHGEGSLFIPASWALRAPTG